MLKNFYEKLFSNNINFKILRCALKTEDIADENRLTELLKDEHLHKNHKGIQAVYKEIITPIYNPKLKQGITHFINNCEICNLEKYYRKPSKINFQNC